ncbi:large ribosomal subunit protein mL64-like [Ptychodera flava]|uniref:large ribosomal subunit protein mL64-like n=1 Tax=Ptychodera flava TaxID=63121 RepID=UPI003969F262
MAALCKTFVRVLSLDLRSKSRLFPCILGKHQYCSAVVNAPEDSTDKSDTVTCAEQLQHEDELPRWMTTKSTCVKLYARHGRASGFDPGVMWPTAKELEEIVEDEKEYPTLQQMQADIETERVKEEKERIKREKHIAASMARMPKLIQQYYEEKEKKREQQRQQKQKRELLLLEAKEKFGYAIDPRHPKFQKYMEEIEKQERKRRKELKKKGIIIKN